MKSYYEKCFLCPRSCGVNRLTGQAGVCGQSVEIKIAFAGIHKGEEPPITGCGGSGTIFITGCNLGCVFCQNYQISKNGTGKIVTPEILAGICINLRDRGAENINIVTASHASPMIAKSINIARGLGLDIPVLWNSSGYDGLASIDILSGIIDVFLPDLKTLDSTVSSKFFNAPDYPEHAAKAICKMITMCNNKYYFNDKGTMVSGVMIRHLVLPGFLDSTRQVLIWFAKNCKGRALLSLMTQYTPVQTGNKNIPSDLYVSQNEYDSVLSMLDEYGIEDGYCQELVTGSDWLPDFNRKNPFSSELSIPVWHWKV